MPRRAQDLTPLGIQKELKAFAASGKKTKALTDGKTPCLRLELTIGASGVNARWTYKKQKTNTADGFNLGLGAYPGVTLRDARCKAEAIAEQIAAGLNPKEERERQAQSEIEAKALAESEMRWRTPFRTVADEWIEVKEKEGLWAHDARGADKARSYLRNWILPVLGDMAINDVDRSACIRLVHYRDMGTRQDTDAKCRRLVNQICIYAHEKGYRQSDEAPANKNDPVFKEACKPLVRRKADKGHFGALPPDHFYQAASPFRRAAFCLFRIQAMKVPVQVLVHQKTRTLELIYQNNARAVFPFEFLRVFSPSAEVQGHSPDEAVLQVGKAEVGLKGVEPVGQYALRLLYDDGHDSGVYSWDYFEKLDRERDVLWQKYLEELEKAGASRDPHDPRNAPFVTKNRPPHGGCGHA